METLHTHCAGLDVHKRSITVCRRQSLANGDVVTEVRTFATHTAALLEMADWLVSSGVTIAAMESTSVYWKPVWHVLEDRCELLLVNAQHLKQVPGRKRDVGDAAWIAQLLACGLLSGSFVPPEPIRELRDLTRTRSRYLGDRNRVANRLQKVLEDANVKLASVASDPLGKSGQAILDALIAGEQDPEVLADLALGALRKKRAELVLALQGQVTAHHRWLLAELLDEWRYLSAKIETVSARIEQVLVPFAAQVEQLQTIPGLGQRAIEVVIAEVGVDMSVFPSDAQLCSWAGLSPGSNESAGKRRSGRCTNGDRWLKATLNQVAWALSRHKDSYLGAKFRRWQRRRGGKRAAVATAHLVLRIIWHILSDPEVIYDERGAAAAAQQADERLTRDLVRRLNRLGHSVVLGPLAEAA